MNRATAYLHLPGPRRRQDSHSGGVRWRNRRAAPRPRQELQPRRSAGPDARPLLAQALRKLGAIENSLWSGRVAAAPELAATRRPLREAKRQPLIEDCDVRPRDRVPMHVHVRACSRSTAQQTATTAVRLELGSEDGLHRHDRLRRDTRSLVLARRMPRSNEAITGRGRGGARQALRGLQRGWAWSRLCRSPGHGVRTPALAGMTGAGR